MKKCRNSEKTAEFARIQCACTNLKMAGRAVGRVYDAALMTVGLNSTQYAILMNVARAKSVAQMKLADHLGLERTTLYRAVYILEKRKWLRSTATGEGVAKVLVLTPQGEKVVKKARSVWEKIQLDFMNSFGKKKWENFLSTLDEIREHFSKRQGAPFQ